MSGDRVTRRWWGLSRWGLAVALAGLGAGCGWKGLAHDQLYGAADAAIEQPVGPGSDAVGTGEDADAEAAGPDSMSPDALSDADIDAPAADGSDAEPEVDAGQADADPDAAPDLAGAADAASDAPPVACTPATCPSDQFCDDISGACLPREGTGMISGAVYDSCLRTPVNAKVGIAGHHGCAAVGKGAYFFSNIPLGRLTVTAAATGYRLFVQEVTVVPGGNTLPIALERSEPLTCADPAPAAVACSCPEPTCVAP